MAEEQDKAAEIGRKLGKALRNARPKAERLAAQAKPHVEKAFDDAVKFARDHEDEAKDVAKKLVKARVGGPLGLVIAAFDSQATPSKAMPPEPAERVCANCGTPNPLGARFCNQCGVRMEPQASH